MTTPPLTCPVVSCQADAVDLTEHLYDHSAGVLAHTLAVQTAELAAARQQLAQVAALLPADPADAINAPWISPRYLRAALAARTQPTT